MKTFCPKCGSEKGPFIRGFCRSCYIEENELASVPNKMFLTKCKRCGSILLKRRWVAENEETLKDFIASTIKKISVNNSSLEIDLTKKEHGYDGLVKISGKAFGTKIEKTYEFEIIYDFKLCDRCGKKASSYYEAEVQIRADNNATANAISYIKSLKDISNEDILKINYTKKGVDILVISNRTAKRIAKAIEKKFGVRVKASTSTVGITKDGDEKRRYTYLLRFEE
ncbi:MAG: 60S ribosomal export protein NMD3 [Candidatus Diapherotrites archaeon]